MTEQTLPETGYTVEYDNEHGHFEMRANFTRDQAGQMASTLFRLPSWGKVAKVVITPSNIPLDTRSIDEIEAQAIA